MILSEVQDFLSTSRSTFSFLEALRIPTIAAIEGIALGGGLEMAMSCVIRICSEDAVIGLPETGLAIIPGAGGTQRLPRLVGKSIAKDLIFTGREISGKDAGSSGTGPHHYCLLHDTNSGKCMWNNWPASCYWECYLRDKTCLLLRPEVRNHEGPCNSIPTGLFQTALERGGDFSNKAFCPSCIGLAELGMPTRLSLGSVSLVLDITMKGADHTKGTTGREL